ncbi:hypothetical protein Anapl_00777 [Anas platyrhynchos]|uniref:Uncharacterized protein n=1 Tax=Anas platyrhynchos TaxID=8839 RepID=R0L4G2_ANAPL|nr:hypothetical protein Anapl_00777 [Anas platyrhynchos]
MQLQHEPHPSQGAEHGSVSKTQNSKVCCTAKQETQIKEFQTAVYHKPVKTMYIVQIVIGETDQKIDSSETVGFWQRIHIK